MTFLTYLTAAALLLWSLIGFTTNLRPIPAYVLGILRNPFNVTLWRGFVLGPVVLLLSVYVGVRALLDPTGFWLKATVVFIVVNIIATILVWYFLYRITKPDYDEYKREQPR